MTQSDEVAKKLRALANPTSLRALGLMLSVDDPVCVCELACALELPEYKVSRHLAALRTTGFVEGEHRGPWVYYRPIPSDLLSALRTQLPGNPEALRRLRARMKLRKGGRCVVGPPPQGGN
jgi:ArsR family transcriptional regulator